MASTTIREYAAPATARLNRTRALGVGGAVVAAVAVWVVAVPLLGLHLTVRFGNAAPESVGVDFVVGASLIGSLLGWGLLAVLERRTARARTIWTAAAVAVLLVSVSLPLSAGTTASTKVALAMMHVAVGAVLITTLRSRSARYRV
jgi:predicted permease